MTITKTQTGRFCVKMWRHGIHWFGFGTDVREAIAECWKKAVAQDRLIASTPPAYLSREDVAWETYQANAN